MPSDNDPFRTPEEKAFLKAIKPKVEIVRKAMKALRWKSEGRDWLGYDDGKLFLEVTASKDFTEYTSVRMFVLLPQGKVQLDLRNIVPDGGLLSLGKTRKLAALLERVMAQGKKIEDLLK